MTEKIKEAIRIIEDAGGFVMMQGDLEDQEQPLTEAQMDKIEAEQLEALEEYQSRKRDAFKDFDRALGSKDFSYSKVEDLMHYHGVDMDDLEEYIHGHY